VVAGASAGGKGRSKGEREVDGVYALGYAADTKATNSLQPLKLQFKKPNGWPSISSPANKEIVVHLSINRKQ